MRGNLPKREPDFLKFWQDNKIYEKRLKKRDGAPKFILHDGPPYANGKIHIGHALNKVLKDIILKYKTQQGCYTKYVPGWDTHGLPIEHAVIKDTGLNRHEMAPLDLRAKCRDYALARVEEQKKDFVRLGVLGDWDHPYLTLRKPVEVAQIGVFGEMAKKGYIYKGLKTVYWCPHCGGTHFRKETDIMDVWFDSGCTHQGVLKNDPDLDYPCEMYLEGSDQHRGWFNSSLLTSVAVNGYAPYKSVLTHGFTVDGEGRKMSKSVGNTVAPQEVIEKYGADVLRLWVSSADYQGDIRLSPKILKQLSDVYRKIRNTFRYLLGNLADFNPAKDMIAYQDMTDLDKWALLRLEQVFEEVTDAYENYQFHVMYHAIHNFCTVDLSAMYLDVIKDRLYTEKADSQIRRSAQSAMYVILDTLVKIVAPVLSFTAEEVWQNMPAVEGKEESVLLTDWPKAHKEYLDADLDARWAQFLSYRRDLTRVLEGARKEHKIGHALDAAVTIYADGEDYDFLSQWQDQLATLLIVSEAKLVKGEAPADAVAGEDHGDMKVVVAPSTAEKCERCWIHSDTVGSDPNHPTLCARCAAVLSE